MVDTTDDWMNPPTRSYSYKPPEYPRFLIERKRRLEYHPFEEWGLWESFDSREDRDAALMELYKKHPVWILRKRDELTPPRAYLRNTA